MKYYVATDGNDSNPGTKVAPWMTVHRAATTAVAGDIVSFEDGSYPCSQVVWNDGVTFRAVNRRLAIWEYDGDTVVYLPSRAFLKFEQLKITGDPFVGTQAVRFTSCSHIVMDDCEIADCQGWGIRVIGGSHLTFTDCDVHPESTIDNALDAIYLTGGVTDVTITGGSCYHSAHDGVKVGRAERVLIDGVDSYENRSHGISIGVSGSGASLEVEVKNCRARRNGTWQVTDGDETGIRVHDAVDGISVHHNVIDENNSSGVSLDDVTGAVTLEHNSLYGNDAQGKDWGDIMMDNDAAETPIITVQNNIIYHTRANTRTLGIDSDVEAFVTFSHNLYYDLTGYEHIRRNGTTYTSYAAYKAALEASAVVSQDPLFVDPATGDFRLQAGSPAIDAGLDLGYGCLDIGAYGHKGDLMSIVDDLQQVELEIRQQIVVLTAQADAVTQAVVVLTAQADAVAQAINDLKVLDDVLDDAADVVEVG